MTDEIYYLVQYVALFHDTNTNSENIENGKPWPCFKDIDFSFGRDAPSILRSLQVYHLDQVRLRYCTKTKIKEGGQTREIEKKKSKVETKMKENTK